MNTEQHLPPPLSTEEIHPISLPNFLSSSSSSLKPLRDRNRTNLKRRINLSRSQVLSNDFENEDNQSTITKITSSQPQSTPVIHTHTELYTKTISPTTPSPIQIKVTCSQVWERLASNEEHQNPISPKSNLTTTSSLPTHISFSFDPSDDDDDEDLIKDDKDDFKYVPINSQSKLVQFQFLAFARQQQLDLESNENEQDVTITEKIIQHEEGEEDNDNDDDNQQENRTQNKRKRSVSTTDSLDDISAIPSSSNDPTASSSVTKPPRTKKPKIKDPNANFQRLNMRKKQFSHSKKHQFAKHKRNAFYRRMRNAGGT